MGRVIPWEEIREKYETGGWSYTVLGKEYGLSPSAVSKRARREQWKGAGQIRREDPVCRCLTSAARQLSASVNETVREGQVSVKELKELTAMLRELVNLQEVIAARQDGAAEVRVVMEEDRFEYLRREDRQAYQALLRHLASKASAEQRAADGQTMNDGKPGKKEKKPILSSTAGDSLQRAMGNYLKGGDKRSAKLLYDRYSYRMTPGQKKRAARLFGKYGVGVDD